MLKCGRTPYTLNGMTPHSLGFKAGVSADRVSNLPKAVATDHIKVVGFAGIARTRHDDFTRRISPSG